MVLATLAKLLQASDGRSLVTGRHTDSLAPSAGGPPLDVSAARRAGQEAARCHV
jgi:hypothetical protein